MITSVAIPTKNRPTQLKACVESIIRTTRRPLEFTIADSSSNPEETIEVLNQIEDKTSVCHYYGPEQRLAFATQLAKHAQVDSRVVQFALLPAAWADVTMGASRNLLSLLNPGQFVMVDDDMVCEFVQIPNCSSVLNVSGVYVHQPDTTFYPTQEDRRKWKNIKVNFLAKHDQLLGRTIPEGSGHVAITVGGNYGDSGVGHQIGFLLAKSSIIRDLAKSEVFFIRALTFGQLLRAATQPTIAKRAFCTGMTMGIDNNVPLPPFLPIQRGEDFLFGFMAVELSGQNYMGVCNYAMHHTPMRTNDLGKEFERVAQLSLAGFLTQFLWFFGANTYEDFGRGLAELSRKDEDFFTRHVQHIAQGWAFKRRIQIEESLQANSDLPTWIKNLIWRIHKAHKNIQFRAPYDIPSSLFRSVVGQFGDLVIEWPKMVEAARSLKAKGAANGE